MQGFWPNLPPRFKNLKKCSLNNILQLGYNYMQYLRQYEQLYEINFNDACTNNIYIYFILLLGNYIRQPIQKDRGISQNILAIKWTKFQLFSKSGIMQKDFPQIVTFHYIFFRHFWLFLEEPSEWTYSSKIEISKTFKSCEWTYGK